MTYDFLFVLKYCDDDDGGQRNAHENNNNLSRVRYYYVTVSLSNFDRSVARPAHCKAVCPSIVWLQTAPSHTYICQEINEEYDLEQKSLEFPVYIQPLCC